MGEAIYLCIPTDIKVEGVLFVKVLYILLVSLAATVGFLA